MKNCRNILFKLALVFPLIALCVALQSCGLLLLPLLALQPFGYYYIDVSNEFRNGCVIGREYILLKDAQYLQKDAGDPGLSISTKPLPEQNWKNENGEGINICDVFYIIPKGSKFRICSVSAKMHYIERLPCHKIYAVLVDDCGRVIPKRCFNGTVAPLEVTDLFKNTGLSDHPDCTLRPDTTWIVEVQ